MNNWSHRKSHIVNQQAGAGTLYQVFIRVFYGAGADSGRDVYLNGECKTDFGDIRFTDNDGTTLLSYYIEEKIDSNYAYIWVKVNDDLSAGNQTIYIYYGNASVSTTSSGIDTFLLFEQWDTDTTGSYTKYSVTYDAVNKRVNVGVDASAYFGCIMKGDYGDVAIRGKVNIEGAFKLNYTEGGIVLRSKVNPFTGRYDNALVDGTTISQVLRMTDTGIEIDSDAFVVARSTWYWVEYGGYGSTLKGKAWAVGGTEPTIYASSAVDATWATGKVGFFSFDKLVVCDDLEVRKFVFPEPAHGVWGAEEDPPITEVFLDHTLNTSSSLLVNKVLNFLESLVANASESINLCIFITILFKDVTDYMIHNAVPDMDFIVNGVTYTFTRTKRSTLYGAGHEGWTYSAIFSMIQNTPVTITMPRTIYVNESGKNIPFHFFEWVDDGSISVDKTFITSASNKAMTFTVFYSPRSGEQRKIRH